MSKELLPPLVPAPSSLSPNAAPPWTFPELPVSALSPDWFHDFFYILLGLALGLVGWLVLQVVRSENVIRSLAHVSQHASIVILGIGLGIEPYNFYQLYSKSKHWNEQVYQEWGYLLSEPVLSGDFDPSNPKGTKEYTVDLRAWPKRASKSAMERKHTLYATPSEVKAYQAHHFVLLRRLSHTPREKNTIYEVVAPDGRRLSVQPWRISRDEVLSRKDAKRLSAKGQD